MKKPIDGLGVDASGGPVVDPTANVLQLVEAAVGRLDDMRRAESAHLRDLLERDRQHAAEIRALETGRLNAIRDVDLAAVQRAAEVQAQAALTLQGQVAASAEAMRTQMAAAAGAAAERLALAVKPLSDVVAALQQQQYINAGQKVQVEETRDSRGETRLNLSAVVAVVGFLLALTMFLTRR